MEEKNVLEVSLAPMKAAGLDEKVEIRRASRASRAP